MMDNLNEVLNVMVNHQLAVVADKKLDLVKAIRRLQRQLAKTKETNKNFNEQWKFLHDAHEDLMGQVERIYGV